MQNLVELARAFLAQNRPRVPFQIFLPSRTCTDPGEGSGMHLKTPLQLGRFNLFGGLEELVTQGRHSVHANGRPFPLIRLPCPSPTAPLIILRRTSTQTPPHSLLLGIALPVHFDTAHNHLFQHTYCVQSTQLLILQVPLPPRLGAFGGDYFLQFIVNAGVGLDCCIGMSTGWDQGNWIEVE